MHLSAGVLTARGGMTSHAAVVARGMGKVNLKIYFYQKVLCMWMGWNLDSGWS